MAITDAVIPVAGLGTRLLPATRSQPKEMLPLVDKPVVQYVVEELVAGRDRARAVRDRPAQARDRGPLRRRSRARHRPADRPAHRPADLLHAPGAAGRPRRRDPLRRELRRRARASSSRSATRSSRRRRERAPRDRAPADRGVRGGAAPTRCSPSGGPDAARSRYGIARRRRRRRRRRSTSSASSRSPTRATVASRHAVMGRYVLGPRVFAALRETPPGASGEVQLDRRAAARDRRWRAGRRRAAGGRRAPARHRLGRELLRDVHRVRAQRPEASARRCAHRAAELLDEQPLSAGDRRGVRAGGAGRQSIRRLRRRGARACRSASCARGGDARTRGAELRRRARQPSSSTRRCDGSRATTGPARCRARSRELATTIPRGVGLGGSSAIVIATAARAVRAASASSSTRRGSPASRSRSRPRSSGSRPGLQDRVAQAYGGLTFMDFAAMRFEPLDPATLPPLVIAWREDAAADSGSVHDGLRARFGRGDTTVAEAMRALAPGGPRGASRTRARRSRRVRAQCRRKLRRAPADDAP